MHLRAVVPLAGAAALFGASLFVTVTAAPAPGGSMAVSRGRTPAGAQAARPSGANESGNYVGPGSCSAVACHGAIRPVAGARIQQTEYSTWVSQDRHARATDVLSNPVSQRMGRILGIGDPSKAQKCLACHALDVPAAQQGRNFTTEGVSCEACHGPATGWLGYHVTKDARHEESVRLGMYDTKDVVKRTEKCLTCHLGTTGKFVDHQMIAGGHPDLVFELESFSAAMPRHWREPADAPAYAPVRTFAVGELVHLRAGLDRLARRVKGPIWPEYAELDCFACHHSLTRPEDSWRQEHGYAHRAAPGLPPLQVSWYLTARPVLEVYDASAASELQPIMDKLQIEASRLTVKPDDVSSLASQARAIVDRGVAKAVASTPSAETANAMLRGIFADTPQIADRGERSAEQAAMAAETLARALAAGRGQDPASTRPIFNDVFQQFESPSSYDPGKFTAAMKRIESAIR